LQANMMISRERVAVIAAFAAIYVIWGSTYMALALALQSLPPFLLMAGRCLAGGAVLYGYASAARMPTPTSRTWLTAAVCGLLFFVGCHGVLAYAQQRVPSGLAAVLLATIPLWIALLQSLLPGKDLPTWRARAFLAPGVAGVALIAWRGGAPGTNAVSFVDILLLLLASLSWAAGTVISERRSNSTSPLAVAGLQLLTGGVALLGISAVRGEFAFFQPSQVSTVSLAGWAYLTIFGTIIAFAAYIWLLKRVSPTIVATYTFVNPLIAVLLGWAFLGETPTIWMIGGAILVVASVAGSLHARGKSRCKEETSWPGRVRESAI
jgi:drug/metabolite transporter (DMT)-like permease